MQFPEHPEDAGDLAPVAVSEKRVALRARNALNRRGRAYSSARQ
jgi:hypothetical protein